MPPTPYLPSISASRPESNAGGKRSRWHLRLPFTSPPLEESDETLGREISGVATNTSSQGNARWWKIRLFKGMANDIRRRAPFYWSDWKDAWDYRVIPATIYMYFANCDIFGFYVAFIYLQKGIQVLTRQWATGGEAAYLSITVALLVLMTAYLFGVVGDTSLFQRYVRKFIEDYGTPLTIIFFTGFVHIGKMADVDLQTLPTNKAFFPTQDRAWFIHFWDIDVGDVFIAIPFAVLLTILFYFDHNVSSLIAQGTEFPLRKPAGFHWDIFLLGLTTGVAGLLGIPFPNGLIPQAPFHTNALCVTRQVSDESETGAKKGHNSRVVDHVVEQRVSSLAQGLLTLGTMSGPLLVVLHLIPRGVLAGLFFVMGVQALEGNGITLKILHLAREQSMTTASDPLSRIQRKKAIWYFVALELLGFGATFAITQTIAAIGFPIIILVLVPVRTFLLPKYFTQEELSILDAPTASRFTMESVGGNFGEEAHAAFGDDGSTERPQSAERRDVDDSTERGEAGNSDENWTSPGFNMKDNGNGKGGDSYELQQQGTQAQDAATVIYLQDHV
ncbi:MAG: hypothetical protein Q9218_002203 [Villophora microphyllina]